MPAANQTAFNLAQLEIIPFTKQCEFNAFGCGQPSIDRFLKNKAGKAVRRHEQRIFCACLIGTKAVIGYYALQLGSENVSDLPNSMKNNYLKSRVAFPAIQLTFIGVDTNYQRQGLGSFLLMDALNKVAAIAEYAGFFALTLVAIDSQTAEFYQKIGFSIYSEDLKNPKLLYPLEDILTLFRRN